MPSKRGSVAAGSGRKNSALAANRRPFKPARSPHETAPQAAPTRSLATRGLLPGSLRYYAYAGSLTTPTPACQEDVAWMVLAQPITVGAGDIAAFAKLYPVNARQPQPIKARKVEVSS